MNKKIDIYTYKDESTFKLLAKSIRIACFWLYIVLSPLNIISVSFGWSVMKYVSFIILSIYLLFGIADFKLVISSPKKVWMLYLIYVCLTLLWSDNGNNSLTNVLGKVETGCFAFLLINDSIPKKTQKVIENGFLISGCIVILFSLLFGSLDTTSRLVINDKLFLADGNEINTYLIMPVIICIKRSFNKGPKDLLVILLHVSIIVLSLYVCLLTGSRSGLISLLTAIVFSVFAFIKLKIKKVFLALSILAFLYLFIINVVLPSLPQDMLQRYSFENAVNDKGSERLIIWETQWHYLTDNPARLFFGYGFGGINGYQRASHNVFLQEIVCGGFVGLSLFILLLISLIRYSYSQGNISAIIGLLSSISIYMFLSLNSSNKATWIIFMFALYQFRKED